MLFPVIKEYLKECKFSSPYGPRWGKLHRGIDIAMPVGTPLVAIEDGEIIYSKLNNGGVTKGYGYYVVVKYDNGLYSLYAHLRELSKFEVGDRVYKGQIVAYSGNTGNSTGPHVHFEIHENGFLFPGQVVDEDTAVDPLKYYPLLGEYQNKYLREYADIKTHDENTSLYAVEARNWVMKNNISDGLRPKENGREEMWTMLYRAHKLKEE